MKKRRHNHGSNAGASADIAFLLLIFFMVVTTFNKAYEIELTLPPLQENVRKGTINKSRLLNILLNENSDILIENREYEKKERYSLVEDIDRITSSSKPGVIKIKMHPETSYESYVKLLSSLKRDKQELLNTRALESYQMPYEQLNPKQKQKILSETKYSIIENEIQGL